MLEILIVLLILGALMGAGVLVSVITGPGMVVAGMSCVVLGMLIGVPTGAYYHVKLHAALAPRDELPPRWWLQPTTLHGHLRPQERRRVMPWFYAGGAGFALTILGCGAMLLGVYLSR